MLQYIQDHDDHYPLTQFQDGSHGWAEQIHPYARSTQLYQCPSELFPCSGNPQGRDYTDYWFNRNLSSRGAEMLASSSSTILLGDGNDGMDLNNAGYNKSRLPPVWRSQTTSPAFRHVEGANYAFADGHTKWVKPARITAAPVKAGVYTFLIK